MFVSLNVKKNKKIILEDGLKSEVSLWKLFVLIKKSKKARKPLRALC